MFIVPEPCSICLLFLFLILSGSVWPPCPIPPTPSHPPPHFTTCPHSTSQPFLPPATCLKGHWNWVPLYTVYGFCFSVSLLAVYPPPPSPLPPPPPPPTTVFSLHFIFVHIMTLYTPVSRQLKMKKKETKQQQQKQEGKWTKKKPN